MLQQEVEVHSTPEQLPEEELKSEITNKPLSHAKLSSLAKARSAKLLKQQQENYKQEMTMTTLNNIYEKLNLIDTKLFSIGKRTANEQAITEQPATKKPKTKPTEKEKEKETKSLLSYAPLVGIFIVSSVLLKYATNRLREDIIDRFTTTSDREHIGWGWLQRDFS